MKKVRIFLSILCILAILGSITAYAIEASSDCPECGASMHTRLWKKYTYISTTSHRVITDYYDECNDCGYIVLDYSTMKTEAHTLPCTKCSVTTK